MTTLVKCDETGCPVQFERDSSDRRHLCAYHLAEYVKDLEHQLDPLALTAIAAEKLLIERVRSLHEELKTQGLLLEAEKAISANAASLLRAKESELKAVEVFSAEEVAEIKAWRDKLVTELRACADRWLRDAATVDHPMRLQSPSWPIECAGDIENILMDLGCDDEQKQE